MAKIIDVVKYHRCRISKLIFVSRKNWPMWSGDSVPLQKVSDISPMLQLARYSFAFVKTNAPCLSCISVRFQSVFYCNEYVLPA